MRLLVFSMPTTVRQQDRRAYPVPPPTPAWGVPNVVTAASWEGPRSEEADDQRAPPRALA